MYTFGTAKNNLLQADIALVRQRWAPLFCEISRWRMIGLIFKIILSERGCNLQQGDQSETEIPL